uniref:DUF148 domain-containing protein n=1 Tax=Ascaris lumbricoides TaxID=6252 RepID=A0A0M3HRR4_ASCLU
MLRTLFAALLVNQVNGQFGRFPPPPYMFPGPPPPHFMPPHPFPPFPLPPPPFFMPELPPGFLFPPDMPPPDTENSWSSQSQRQHQKQWEQWRKHYDKQWREYQQKWQQQVKQWQRRQQQQWQQQQRSWQPQTVQPTVATTQRNTAPVTASTYDHRGVTTTTWRPPTEKPTPQVKPAGVDLSWISGSDADNKQFITKLSKGEQWTTEGKKRNGHLIETERRAGLQDGDTGSLNSVIENPPPLPGLTRINAKGDLRRRRRK